MNETGIALPIIAIVAAGSFIGSYVSASFSSGGGYILFAFSTAVLPLASAIALQSTLSFGSLLSRVFYFRHHIDWSIVKKFSFGSIIGALAGLFVYANAPEAVISIFLGLLLLLLVWLPTLKDSRLKHPFFTVGVTHAFVGSTFGIGAILQPVLLRTSLAKLEMIGTLAACLILLESIKTVGYFTIGFDYRPYLLLIAVATFTGVVGAWAGKRTHHLISDALFRIFLKLFISALGIRFILKGVNKLHFG